MAENKMSGLRARLDYALKHNYFLYRLFNAGVSTFMRIWGVFLPIKKNLVLFSGLSRGYNDSPRVLYEYMLAHPEKYGQYICVWAVEDVAHSVIPGEPIKVKADTLKYFKYTLMAGYWITSVNIERSLHYKKKACRYLNTWHGTPFKHIGNDARGRKDYDFGDINYFCCASEFEKKIYIEAFHTKENAMLPTGLPRNDELYKVTPEDIVAIRLRLGIPKGKKIILYAPTWRDSDDYGKSYVIKPPIDVAKWVNRLGDRYVVLFRTHAYTNKLLGIEFNDVVLDYSQYPLINDLLKISDILISDYSATMADYAILERPILTFVYDYDEYKKKRGLYLDYAKDMPSGILRTEDEVLDYIVSMDYDYECCKTKNMIKERLLHWGGNATIICLDKLFEN